MANSRYEFGEERNDQDSFIGLLLLKTFPHIHLMNWEYTTSFYTWSPGKKQEEIYMLTEERQEENSCILDEILGLN